MRVDALLSAAEGQDETAAAARLIRVEWEALTGAPEAMRGVESTLSRLIEHLALTGDERLLARTHLAAVKVNWQATKYAAANEHARLSAEHARRIGDDGLRAKAIGYLAGGLIFGPESAEAVAKELDAYESERLGAYAEAFIRHNRGELARLSGRFPEARQLMQHAIDQFHELGIHVIAGACYHQLAAVEIQASEPSSAFAALRQSDAILDKLGERGFRSTTQAELALVHTLLGEAEAAQAAIELAEELADPDDTATHAIVQSVKAELARRDGDGDAAERWARSAVALGSHMDMPGAKGHLELELARVLGTFERPREAITHAHTALELFTAKGDKPSALEAQTLLNELATRS